MPRRVLQGKVVSSACDKSVVIEITRRVMHPLYKKFLTRSKKFMAHDPNNSCAVGDIVRIEECRPISKRKRWQVVGSQEK